MFVAQSEWLLVFVAQRKLVVTGVCGSNKVGGY